MRRGGPRGAVGIAVVFVALALAKPSAASPEEAKAQFEAGQSLVKSGKPGEAIPKFLASIAEAPTIAAMLNLADCYERVGKLASARARFLEAYELAKAKDPLRADEAQKRAALLEPRVSTVTLIPPSKTDGVRVWIDGVEVPSSLWGAPRAFDSGTHEVVTMDAHGKRTTKSLDVPTVATPITFPIEVDEAESAPAAPAAPDKGAPETPPSTDGSQRTVGIIVGATGLVTLGFGAVSGVLALGAKSDLESTCGSYPQCPSSRRGEAADLDDRAHTFGTLSTVTLIAGAVFLGVGTVLYLTAPTSKTEPQMQGKVRLRYDGFVW